MRATLRGPLRPDPSFQDFDFELSLLLAERAGPVMPGDGMPPVPASWRMLEQVSGIVRHYAVYRDARGLVIQVHSRIGVDEEAVSGMIALVGLGTQRVAVHRLGAGFEARWGSLVEAHRIVVDEAELVDFMDLLLGLVWP